jgi:hypothetical protein
MTRAHAKLRARVVPVQSLTADQRTQMWSIFQAYYADVTQETFLQDLSAKDDVILLQDRESKTLCGFSTLVTYQDQTPATDATPSKRYCVVFSGDTVIDARYWGQRALQRAFVRYLAFQKCKRPHLPLFWLLITKGYKTYLLLTRNFPRHWPSHHWPTPPWHALARHQIAQKLFGDHWLPELGIIRHPNPLGRLREDVAPIDPDLVASDPDVRFFQEQNPGHAQGDELVCLGEFGLHMCLHFIKRQFAPRPPKTPHPTQSTSQTHT